MFFGLSSGNAVRFDSRQPVFILLALSVLSLVPSASRALPRRLVLGLDGIAYRDMQALQAGVTYTNAWGTRVRRQAFSAEEGYFPVSRLVSTFPSTSDVAWTDIYGDRPLPGYQRTYFSAAANAQIVINGITTTMEHENQMDYQLENGLFRTMGYVYPVHTFELEVREMIKSFWNATDNHGSFYVYIRATDDAQHLDRDVFAMLSTLDERLQTMRTRYRTQEGRDLQILILSDHGHNHASSFKRVQVGAFLEKAGYRITGSIQNLKDVVMPTTGIEDWIEIHNASAATETLAPLLTHLEGADIVTGHDPNNPHRFIVMNSQGERAMIDWNPASNTYRYSAEQGDPLNYLPAVEALAGKKLLDADGFATADAWMAATLTNHYPLALERIVRGLTRVTLNPATILISLSNNYVHCGPLLKGAASLSPFSSTHGALDSRNSDGIVLSNYTPTRDTSSDRVAGLFDDFPGLRNFRAAESGAEFVTKSEESFVRIPRDPLARDGKLLPNNEIFLRVWSPNLSNLDASAPVNVLIEQVEHFSKPQTPRWATRPATMLGRHLTFNQPATFLDPPAYERIYVLPPDLILKPQTEYRISGWLRDRDKSVSLFEFNFYTDSQGRPAAF
jgi:hypothetical protein